MCVLTHIYLYVYQLIDLNAYQYVYLYVYLYVYQHIYLLVYQHIYMGMPMHLSLQTLRQNGISVSVKRDLHTCQKRPIYKEASPER